jgi:hypothetical protein
MVDPLTGLPMDFVRMLAVRIDPFADQEDADEDEDADTVPGY